MSQTEAVNTVHCPWILHHGVLEILVMRVMTTKASVPINCLFYLVILVCHAKCRVKHCLLMTWMCRSVFHPVMKHSENSFYQNKDNSNEQHLT